MFVVGNSYIPLLQEVVARCEGVMLDFICEFTDDGVVLAGIELDMPFFIHRCEQRCFFSFGVTLRFGSYLHTSRLHSSLLVFCSWSTVSLL